MTHFTLTPRGPFSLSVIRDFSCGLMVALRDCPSAPNEVHRVRRAQATKWQGEIARACGDVITVAGVELASFPQPESFLSRRRFEGVRVVAPALSSWASPEPPTG